MQFSCVSTHFCQPKNVLIVMQRISSVSTVLCRPKIVFKFGAVLLSDLRAVQGELKNKFQDIKIKQQLIVIDPIFADMSLQQQRELVLRQLPENIMYEIELKTKSKKIDNSISQVQLKKNVIVKRSKASPTPQMHLDFSVMYYERGNGKKSLKFAWLAVKLQLKNLLFQNCLDSTHDEALESFIIYFLKNNCFDEADSKSKNKLVVTWLALQGFYYSECNYVYPLDLVYDSIIDAVDFCNIIYSIYEKKCFNGIDFLKSMKDKENFLEKIQVIYNEKISNSYAEKLFILKKILLMGEEELIEFVKNSRNDLLEKQNEVLNFQLLEAEERLNEMIYKKKTI